MSLALCRTHTESIDASADLFEPRWYAAYTYANHEKRVAEQFRLRSVQHFFPTYKTIRRWKDRKVQLQMPLFPGYIFVCLALVDRLKVLTVPSVARLVGFSGQPVALPESEILALKTCLTAGISAEPYPYLIAGKRVRIISGALAGYEGNLVRHRGQSRVVISIELISQSAAVEVDASCLVPVHGQPCDAGREVPATGKCQRIDK